MINKENRILREWKIYDAENFRSTFKIKEERKENECDEDFIMEHLEKDKRVFEIEFIESPRQKEYEEYWIIKEIESCKDMKRRLK